MSGLKLIHVNERGPRQWTLFLYPTICHDKVLACWCHLMGTHRSPVDSLHKGQWWGSWYSLDASPNKLWKKHSHDDVIKWNHFPRYWPFVRVFTGHRWIPLTQTIDAELWCFLWSAPDWIIETTVIWAPSRPLWRHCNARGRWSETQE